MILKNKRYGHFAIVLFLMILFIDRMNECEKPCGQKRNCYKRAILTK